MRLLQVIGPTRRTGHGRRRQFRHSIRNHRARQVGTELESDQGSVPFPQPGGKPVSKPLPCSSIRLGSSDRGSEKKGQAS